MSVTGSEPGRAGRVLVTGATGDIGGEVVRLLVGDGVPVRAICRRQSQTAELRASGAEPVIADLDDAESLRRAMEGCDQLFLLTAPLPNQFDQEKRAIDSAVAAGVRNVVRISAADSSLGTGVPWAQAHARADGYLAASTLEWTVLRPTAFLQNLAEQASTIRLGFLPQTTGRGRASWIDNRDVAAVAAHVLTHSGHGHATYFLTGPEALSMRAIAARLSRQLSRRVRYLHLPSWIYAVLLRLAGQSWWTAKGLRIQFAEVLRPGHDLDTTYEVERLLGRPARSVDDYLRDHLADFQGRLRRSR